jgi:hypothetical protein
MITNIVEPAFYNLDMLAKKWGCEADEILQYGVTGQLQISVLCGEWWVEIGYYEDAGDEESYFPVPLSYEGMNNKLMPLYASDVQQILITGSVTLDYFPVTAGYSRISSKHHSQNVIITRKQIMIKKADAEALSGKIIQNPTIPSGGYTSPYIELMKQAITELKITNENQGKHEELKTWFLSQKIENHKITANEAKLMATFVRMPASKAGGNKKFKSG